MHVSVREATAGDRPRIRDVHLASIEGLAGQAYDDDQVAAWAHDRSPDDYPTGSPETYFVVAERDDDVVGFGWMKPDADEYFQASVEGEVTAVYVLPPVARSGVGSRLYAALETRARDRGVASLGLRASRNAVPFYEAHGYERVTDHRHELHDGVEATLVEMKKVLD